jgi:peroxiredoxin Q/BCP
VIFGASFDTVQDNKKFAEKFNFPYPLLSATPEMGDAYGAGGGANAKRIAYVIDENGRIQEAHEKVSAGSYPHEQLERLQAAKL